MQELLTLAHGFPRWSVAAGDSVLAHGESVGTLYAICASGSTIDAMSR